jgi:hypothetical protein
MPLNVAMVRPLRTRAELTALVEAIALAPASEHETDYLEWKSSFDLRGRAEHKFEAGKHVIGFGNRHPGHAARVFGGCSYLVLGAEPQSVAGVPFEDAADLESWIGAYVGSDGPQWSPTYIECDGKQVLVVTVEAPTWGDYPFTLARGFGSFEAGQVFIRRAGKTVKPNQAEVKMLTERAKRASDRIALNVELAHVAALRTFDSSAQDRQDWVASEGKRLSAPLHRPRPEPPPSLVPSVRLPEDFRNRDEYVSEMQLYLARAGERWQALVLAGAVRSQMAPVALRITNPTDQNFAGVEVVVTLPDQAWVFFGPDGPFGLINPREPPDVWGDHPFPVPSPAPTTSFEPRGEVRKRDNHFEVTFAPVQVRPRRPYDLPILYLALSRRFAGEAVTLSWVATSTSAEGSVAGELELPVAPDSTPATALVSAAEAALT